MNGLSRRGFVGSAAVGAASILGMQGRRETAWAQEKPPGRMLFARNGDIWLWQAGEVTKLLDDGTASDPCWSPDGRRILFVRTGDGFADLYIRSLVDGAEQQLTFNQPGYQLGSVEYVLNSSWALDPDWAPSGLIAFASDAYTDYGRMNLFLIEDLAAGPGLALAAQEEGNVEDISLSVEGSVAGYTVRGANEAGLNWSYVALRDLNDGVAYLLCDDPNGSFDPAVAPNDTQVAVVIRDAGSVSDIWIIDRQTGDRVAVTSQAQAVGPVWSPDGAWLAYWRMIDYAFELWASPMVDGAPQEPRRIGGFKNVDAPSGLSWTYAGG